MVRVGKFNKRGGGGGGGDAYLVLESMETGQLGQRASPAGTLPHKYRIEKNAKMLMKASSPVYRDSSLNGPVCLI